MKTPFRLDDHPRRTSPLAPPPDGYFERLPRQVMERVQPVPAAEGALPGWLLAFSRPMRTALASVVLLGGFATSFFLSQQIVSPQQPVADSSAALALANVPRTEMVQYLLASDQRVTLPDLAELPGTADQTVTDSFLQASSAEVQDILDEQPTDDLYL
ncbi:hypothetical protein [Hymenobacter sp. BT730]|uniref:hypothetical protein n=1 Tax=Hymenobacter sp. BT730 TaxID=3063332 RepID=UPI0026E0D641|nr:hypothetical protein [Hymenobacter sp. BT730]